MCFAEGFIAGWKDAAPDAAGKVSDLSGTTLNSSIRTQTIEGAGATDIIGTTTKEVKFDGQA